MPDDVVDDPTFNPFSEHYLGNDRPTTSQGFYRSAFIPSLTDAQPSTLREEQKPERRREKMGHLRSRSEIQVVPPNSAGLHPLKSALFASVDDSFADVTRPNLFRIVSEGQTSPSHEEESSSNEIDVAIEEKDVILHNVSPTDSLAGVALKYGITLANLRRANQLWMSDSIHRRSVLYIPIEVASRAQEYLQGTKLILSTPDDAPEEATNVFDGVHSSTSSFDGDKSDAGLTKVVRVPANQLTYFPPSSTKNLESTSARNSLDNPGPTLTSGLRISPTSSNKYDPTLPSNSFTSILTALPIAASTRDEIITRLSFDSVSSNHSDTSRGSPTEGNSHELGEVHSKPNNRERKDNFMVFSFSDEANADDTSMPTPRARPLKTSLPPSPTTTATRQLPCVSASLPKSSHIRSVSSCSPPRFYVSQPHETFVRTSQPEASPAMQIPIRRSSTLHASGRKLQAAFGVERPTNSLGRDRRGVKDIDLHSLVRRMKLKDPQP